MATVQIATSEVLILSDRPQITKVLPSEYRNQRVSCLEDLEQAIVETGNPVIVIDEGAYRGCDIEALVLDLAEFDNDRVAGIVILTESGYDPNLLPQLKLAGANRFVTTIDCFAHIEQMIGEAHIDRLIQREHRQKGLEF